MTEATCSLIGWDPTRACDPNSVGELNANCSAKIMAPDGKNEVPVGQRGEIWVQAPKYVSPPSTYSGSQQTCDFGKYVSKKGMLIKGNK
jgi:hypothetical protein